MVLKEEFKSLGFDVLCDDGKYLQYKNPNTGMLITFKHNQDSYAITSTLHHDISMQLHDLIAKQFYSLSLT